SPTTGALDGAFVPPLTAGVLEALSYSSNGSTLYAGGGFVQGGNSHHLGAFAAVTGQFQPSMPGTATPGAPDADGPVIRLLTNGTTVYAAGRFTQLGGASHPYLGAFASST